MKVQNISNTQQNINFQGNVIIVNDLSAIPSKLVRKSAQTLKTMVADKNYDLLIKQNHEQKTVSIIAQNPKYCGNPLKPHVETIINQNKDLYEKAAKNSMDKFEALPQSLPKRAWNKVKELYFKFEDEYYEMLEDLLG